MQDGDDDGWTRGTVRKTGPVVCFFFSFDFVIINFFLGTTTTPQAAGHHTMEQLPPMVR